MPDSALSFRDFSQRLWLAGGRDTIPRNAMRRCVGAAPEPEPLVKSRWGSTLRFAVPNVISMGCFSDSHYLYDGANLWKAKLNDPAAIVIDTGHNGHRMTMLKAPPAFGVPDYLFVIGGGKLQKVDQNGALTNWGIAAPSLGMTASLSPQNQIVIDGFNASAASWNSVNCAVSNETTHDDLIYSGVGSLKVVPNDGPWSITKDLTGPPATPLNLSLYANGDLSLPTDYISFWVNMRKPADVVWFWLEFDVDPVHSDFKHNYYRAQIQVVPTTANVNAANAAVIISADADRWIQIGIAKSQFERIGTDFNLDWSAVYKIRIKGGDTLQAVAPALYFDLFQMFGGVGLGTGPAALQNGSTVKYLVTFGNSITGNDSNPCSQPTIRPDVIEQAVIVEKIPISSDPQVNNRKLWRTSEGGELYFYLDTIPDNVTTSYMDVISSLPGQPLVTTPWTANVAAAIGHYIDAGNGYFMRCVVGGTTGAVTPDWLLPTTSWTALGVFPAVGDTILPVGSLANRAFKVIRKGTTGPIQPNWGDAPNVGDTLIDGTVTLQNIGPLQTLDGTVTWQTQAFNALPTLGTDEVRYDNTLFPDTCQDAAFFQGSMFVARDTAQGKQSFVYVSSPGRNEGYGNILRVGSEDDPIQKLVVWDERLWVFTSRFVYPLAGNLPDMAVGERILGAEGTSWPFTVVPMPSGIIYRAVSGIRSFNHADNPLIGYEALGPSERGQTVENVSPFAPIIANDAKEEVIFSDGVTSFAYSLASGTWRMLGLGFNAIEYHDEIQVTHVAVAENVLDFEVAGVLADNGLAVPVEWQTPSVLQDGTQLSMTKRLYLDVDLAGEVLTPTLLVDGADIVLPKITNGARGTIAIPWQAPGKVLGVRLTGNVLHRVTWYGCHGEVRNGR